jgi:hypothetical protein
MLAGSGCWRRAISFGCLDRVGARVRSDPRGGGLVQRRAQREGGGQDVLESALRCGFETALGFVRNPAGGGLGFVRQPGRRGLVQHRAGRGSIGQGVLEPGSGAALDARDGAALGFVRCGRWAPVECAAGRDGCARTGADAARSSSVAAGSAWSTLRVRRARMNSAMAALR